MTIGAYADRTSVHYLTLEGDGIYARSQPLHAHPLPAESAALPLLFRDECEMARSAGVTFTGLPEPARVAQGEGIVHFVVGPVHAGIIEPGRFTFSSGGETVVHLDAQFGFSHRGIESALEGRPVLDAPRVVARVCGSCSASRSYAYALAVERLAEYSPPVETELVRLILAELERAYNHLSDLAAAASAAGYGRGFVTGMELKERAMRICRTASGHRLLFDAIVPGGVGAHVLDDRAALASEVNELERAAAHYAETLFTNTSLVSRWKHTGTVSREVAEAFGAVGPAHRASHGTIDVRSFASYGAYRWLPVRIAHGASGDVLARCRVKRDELSESFCLIATALQELGGAALPSPPPLDPGAGVARIAVEGARGSEIVALHADARGRIERLHAISASYRNWPVVVRAMEGAIVPDFPLVNKSFNLCYACADR